MDTQITSRDREMLQLAVQFLRGHSRLLAMNDANDWDFPPWVSAGTREDCFLKQFDGKPPPDWVACGAVARYLESLSKVPTCRS